MSTPQNALGNIFLKTFILILCLSFSESTNAQITYTISNNRISHIDAFEKKSQNSNKKHRIKRKPVQEAPKQYIDVESTLKSGSNYDFRFIGDDRIIDKEDFDKSTLPIGWRVMSKDLSKSWHIESFQDDEERDFKSIDSSSVSSAVINYINNYNFNDTLESKSYALATNHNSIQFYIGMDPDFTLSGIDIELYIKDSNNNSSERLWTASNSIIDKAQEFFSWWKIEVPIPEAYSGKNVNFGWRCIGTNGDQVIIDGMKLKTYNYSTQVEIAEGNSLVYSSNIPHTESLNWHFYGGNPASSTLVMPKVKYEDEGIYDVSLSYANGIITKQNYVKVKAVAPKANFEMPAGVYYNAARQYTLPAKQLISLIDKSSNYPRTWNWTLTGSNIGTSSEQAPNIYYEAEGIYSINLQVGNSAGSDIAGKANNLAVENTTHAWNILPSDMLGGYELFGGYHGYFPGSNTREYLKYAERFSAPLKKCKISKVDIFFVSRSAADMNQEITVSLAKVGADNMPGDIICSAKKRISELQLPQGDQLHSTVFAFDKGVDMESQFFVIVEGIPNGSEDMVVFTTAMPREDKGTAYIYHKNMDLYTGTLLGGEQWDRTEDMELLRKSTSFGLLPQIEYYDIDNSSVESKTPNDDIKTYMSGNIIKIESKNDIKAMYIISIDGKEIYRNSNVESSSISINAANWEKNIYLVKIETESTTKIFKLLN